MIILTITPVENVDYDAMKVVDDSKVLKKEVGWYDTVSVYDIGLRKNINVIAHSVSLFNHRLLLDGVQYHMLHFFSPSSK